MKKIANQLLAVLAAGFVTVLFVPSLASAQTTTPDMRQSTTTTNTATTTDQNATTTQDQTSTTTPGTTTQTPTGGVRAGSGGAANWENGLLAVSALAAGAAGLALARRAQSKKTNDAR